MSEQPKKARDIKDLKARLGRPGGAPSMPGPVSGIPAPLPMPGSQGPGIPRGDVPAPFAPAPVGRPSMPSQTGRMPTQTGPGRGASVPPADPFAAPSGPFAPPGGAPNPAPQARPSMPSDPFAAAPPSAAGPREVRLVIDDKTAVDDAEIGKKSAGKFATAAIVAALAGVLVGWFVGSTWRERQLYDVVLADAKEVYAAVSAATPKVEEAKNLIDKVAKSSANIDFKAIEDLRKLEKPFPADVFSRKHYRALESATVDLLFQYYNNTNLLWAKIAVIAGKSLSPNARESLIKSATTAGDMQGKDYGCIPFKADKEYGCGLVTFTKGAEGKVSVNTRTGAIEKSLFAGQDLSSKTSDFVISVDKARSGDILGGATSQFSNFVRDLIEAKTLADQTVEIQGKLTQQLGQVASLKGL
ncbi:MAG TPA: hypothetical protein VFX59_04270 [Polyangiales bacterium]|nr:hypothetical protein [Polyangiales bacterium]